MSFHSKVVLSLALLSSVCMGMSRGRVMHDPVEGFKVIGAEGIKQVACHNVSRDLMQMHKLNKVREFLDHGGSIRVSQLDNGEYVLRAKVHGLGGGPGTATVAYIGINIASAAAAAACSWCPFLAAGVALGGHALATAAALALIATPTP